MILDPYIQSQSKDSKSDANILSNVEDFALFNTHTPAPEIIGLTNWINFSGVQSLDELKGKVILVDFWTYSCINCQRTLPYLQKWHERYADEGLVILGVHAPEFQFEKDPRNVMKAVQQFGITYPVAQDNDFKTWRNFKNQYRPAKYIIDAA
jgi:thiol-disulfide isomerase/thioredoxin